MNVLLSADAKWEWRIPWRFKRAHQEVAEVISSLPLPAFDMPDQPVWATETSGILTAQSAYCMLAEDLPVVNWGRNIWHVAIQPRKSLIDNAVVEKKNIYAVKENSDDDFEDPQLKIQPKKIKMKVKKEKVGVAVRRNKTEKKAKVTAKKSNKNKKKDVAEEVQEDVVDHFMEIATEQVQEGAIEQVQEDAAEKVQKDVVDHFMEITTEQVQEGVIVLFKEGATKQVQEEVKYLTLEDWVSTEEIENQHAKVDGNGKEMVEFNFENGRGTEGNVDEFEDAIYEQNVTETEKIMKKFFHLDRDGETEVFSKKMKHKKMKYATAQEAENGATAKDDKVADKKGKVENEAQPATSPRTRSIVKRIKGRRDRKEKKMEDYEVQRL
ncbi:hypothetical protein ACLB2K_041972 [Fragaria x ananassa]